MKTKSIMTKGGIAIVTVALLGLAVGTAYAFGPGISLTEEQKDVLEQARDLRMDGDSDAARDLLEKNGLDRSARYGWMKNMHEQHDAVQEAVDTNNFEAFQVAVENSPMADVVTEDIFNSMIEAHSLRENGDYEGARAMMEEFDLPHGKHGLARGFGGCHMEGFEIER